MRKKREAQQKKEVETKVFLQSCKAIPLKNGHSLLTKEFEGKKRHEISISLKEEAIFNHSLLSKKKFEVNFGRCVSKTCLSEILTNFCHYFAGSGC